MVEGTAMSLLVRQLIGFPSYNPLDLNADKTSKCQQFPMSPRVADWQGESEPPSCHLSMYFDPSYRCFLLVHVFLKQSNTVPWHGKSDTHVRPVSDSPTSLQVWNKGSEPLPDPLPKNKVNPITTPWIPASLSLKLHTQHIKPTFL